MRASHLHTLLLVTLAAACTGQDPSRNTPADVLTDGGSEVHDSGTLAPRFEKVVDFTEPAPSEMLEGALDLVYHPDRSGAYFVGYRDGTIEWRDANHAIVDVAKIETRRRNECGLLAIEVDPDFETNGRFYVGYCVPNSGVNLVSFDWTDTSTTPLGDTQTSTVFSMIAGPNDYHNLGDMGWDEEKNLWFTYGDGGRAFEYLPRNLMDGRGKLHRVRPFRDGRHGFEAPADNPFVSDPNVLDSILAYGFKSPYRVDYADGTWFFGDVGLDSFEEINVLRRDDVPRDFGYPDCEGHMALDSRYQLTGEACALSGDYKAPDLVYAHDPDQVAILEDPEGRPGQVGQFAVCGGVLVTSDVYGELLEGRYVYTDIQRGFVRAARFDGERLVDDRHLVHLAGVFQFSLGPDGYLYAIARNALWRFIVAEPPAPPEPRPEPPPLLSEAGLYTDIASRTLAEGVIEYTPRFELWSDGASKRRFLKLPEGESIDGSNPDAWRFPAGTKLFKEFSRSGRPIETRMIEIVSERVVVPIAYVWNEDLSEATAAPDGLADAGGTTHDVPSTVACEDCHFGEPGRILGLSAVQLAASDLARIGPRIDPPMQIEHLVPGTATVAAALGYLHANCGTCHNPNGAAWRDTRMNLRLSTQETTPDETAIYATTVGRALASWRSQTISHRVVANDPDASALWVRMQARGDSDAMPPIATEAVDRDGSALIRAWIEGL